MEVKCCPEEDMVKKMEVKKEKNKVVEEKTEQMIAEIRKKGDFFGLLLHNRSKS